MRRRHDYTIEQLKETVKTSFSKREVLQKLNMVPAGGNYSTLNRQLKEYNIDTTHFTGQLWNKGKKLGDAHTIDYYLNGKGKITSHNLKLRLLKENILEYKCSLCNNTTWLNKRIPLELHHKDGDHDNNSLDNLCLLCPNCHALTDNYRKAKKPHTYHKKEIKKCLCCNNYVKENRRQYCSLKCLHVAKAKEMNKYLLDPIRKEEFIQLLKNYSCREIAKQLGFTHTTINRWKILIEENMPQVGFEPTL